MSIVSQSSNTESFNPRTHTGCDFADPKKRAFRDMFQSTHPHRVRHGIVQGVGKFDFVSIHAPTQGATKCAAGHFQQRKVSIHAPTQGATNGYNVEECRCVVSIHAPTQGATLALGFAGLGSSVSIHAPTQGATDRESKLTPSIVVSIHAPTQGATCCATCRSPPNICFNPRTHTGCDILCLRVQLLLRVSIHAPTQGATKFLRIKIRLRHVSIHAPTQGATCAFVILTLLYLFQSTHPHRVRHCDYFNGTGAFEVSIHAPTQGATGTTFQDDPNLKFQSTHPHRVRPKPFANCWANH